MEKGYRQICVIWILKSMDYLAQIVVIEENESVFKDRALRSVHGMHEEG